MKCNFKIDLINPADDSVVKTVDADGIVTNAQKYLSTCGYPFIMRGDTIDYATQSLDLTAGGIIAFGNKHSTDVDDFKFKVTDPKTAYGTRYSDDYSVYSTKYGALRSDLSGFDRNSFTKVWEWSEGQGNGIISSLCLTHAAGAGAVDNLPPPDKTKAYAMGNDGCATMLQPSGTSASGTAAFQANIAYASSNGIRGTSNWTGQSVSTYYYQTDNYIICLYNMSLNVQTTLEDGSTVYRHTLRYRKIDKKWMYAWRQGLLISSDRTSATYNLHPLSFPIPTDSGDYVNGDWDGTIIFDSPNKLYQQWGSGTAIDSNDYYTIYMQDSFGVSFFCEDPNGSSKFADNYDVGLPSGAKSLIVYVITGDTPYISEHHTYYKCALGAKKISTKTNYIKDGILITKDYNYVYCSFRADRSSTSYANYRYIAKRKLTDNTLIWKKSIDITAGSPPCMPFYWDQNYYCIPFHNVDGTSSSSFTSGVYYYIIGVSDGEVYGYTIINRRSDTRRCLNPKDNNPFFLDPYPVTSTAYGFQSMLNTNYMWAKVNLPEEITKTSAYKMRITVTVKY